MTRLESPDHGGCLNEIQHAFGFIRIGVGVILAGIWLGVNICGFPE